MKIKSSKIFKIIAIALCFSMLFEQSGFAQIAGQLDISGSITAFRNSIVLDKFRPLHLRYLQFDSQANNFNLLLDKGNSKTLSKPFVEKSTQTLLNYFFIGVTLPNDSFWVNLRPDSPDNVIDPLLAQTDIGKILLEADVQLKKDTAKFTSPETPEGKEYWDKLYEKSGQIFGSQNVTIPTLTRPWIVPNEIILRETVDNAYIYKATLKVMLEEDYLKGSAVYNFSDPRLKELNTYASQVLREKIIPKLTQEVNTSKRYAGLRQVYYSLILAQWFKQRFANAVIPAQAGIQANQYISLIDRKNLINLTSKESWSKNTYFQQYQKSFKDGEYNFKVPMTTPYGQVIRSYFSGGIALSYLERAATFIQGKLTDLREGVPNFLSDIKSLLRLRRTPDGSLEMNYADLKPPEEQPAAKTEEPEKAPVVQPPAVAQGDSKQDGLFTPVEYKEVDELQNKLATIKEEFFREINNATYYHATSREKQLIEYEKFVSSLGIPIQKNSRLGLVEFNLSTIKRFILYSTLMTKNLIKFKLFKAATLFTFLFTEIVAFVLQINPPHVALYSDGSMEIAKISTKLNIYPTTLISVPLVFSLIFDGSALVISCIIMWSILFLLKGILSLDAHYSMGHELTHIVQQNIIKRIENSLDLSSSKTDLYKKIDLEKSIYSLNRVPNSDELKDIINDILQQVSSILEQESLKTNPPRVNPNIDKKIMSEPVNLQPPAEGFAATAASRDSASQPSAAARQVEEPLKNLKEGDLVRVTFKDGKVILGVYEESADGRVYVIQDELPTGSILWQKIERIEKLSQEDLNSRPKLIGDALSGHGTNAFAVLRAIRFTNGQLRSAAELPYVPLTGESNGSSKLNRNYVSALGLNSQASNLDVVYAYAENNSSKYVITLENVDGLIVDLKQKLQGKDLSESDQEYYTKGLEQLQEARKELVKMRENGTYEDYLALSRIPVIVIGDGIYKGEVRSDIGNEHVYRRLNIRILVVKDANNVKKLRELLAKEAIRDIIVMDLESAKEQVNRHKETAFSANSQRLEETELTRLIRNGEVSENVKASSAAAQKGETVTIILNGKKEEKIQTGMTVQQLLEQKGLNSDTIAVEINKRLVPKGEYNSTTINTGDVVEYLPLISGGSPDALDKKDIWYKEAISTLEMEEFIAGQDNIYFRHRLNQLKSTIIENGGIKYWQKWRPESIEAYSLEDYIKALKDSSGNLAIHIFNASEDQLQGILTGGHEVSRTGTNSVHFSVNKPYFDGNWGNTGVALVTSLEALLENKAVMSVTSPSYSDDEKFTITDEQDLAVQDFKHGAEGFYFDQLGIIFIPGTKMQDYENFFNRIGRRPKRIYYYKGTLGGAIDDFKNNNNLRATSPIVSGEIRLGHIDYATASPYFVVIAPHSTYVSSLKKGYLAVGNNLEAKEFAQPPAAAQEEGDDTKLSARLNLVEHAKVQRLVESLNRLLKNLGVEQGNAPEEILEELIKLWETKDLVEIQKDPRYGSSRIVTIKKDRKPDKSNDRIEFILDFISRIGSQDLSKKVSFKDKDGNWVILDLVPENMSRPDYAKSIVAISDAHGGINELRRLLVNIGIAAKIIHIGDVFGGENDFETASLLLEGAELEEMILLYGGHDIVADAVISGISDDVGLLLDHQMIELIRERLQGKVENFDGLINDIMDKAKEVRSKAVKELLSAIRSDEGLKNLFKQVRDKFKLFEIQEINGKKVFFIHAGLPVDKNGNLTLKFNNKEGFAALQELEEAIKGKRGKELEKEAFAYLMNEDNPILMGGGKRWFDELSEDALNNLLGQLGEKGVDMIMLGHVAQGPEQADVLRRRFGDKLTIVDFGLAKSRKGISGGFVRLTPKEQTSIGVSFKFIHARGDGPLAITAGESLLTASDTTEPINLPAVAREAEVDAKKEVLKNIEIKWLKGKFDREVIEAIGGERRAEESGVLSTIPKEKITAVISNKEFIAETLKKLHEIQEFSMTDIGQISVERIGEGYHSQVFLITITFKNQTSKRFVLKVARRDFSKSRYILEFLNKIVPGLVSRLGALDANLEVWSEEYVNSTGQDIMKWRQAEERGEIDKATLRDIEKAALRDYYLFHKRTNGGYIHDPKPENFVVFKDEEGNWRTKIIDVGYYDSTKEPSIKGWFENLVNNKELGGKGYEAEVIFNAVIRAGYKSDLEDLKRYFPEHGTFDTTLRRVLSLAIDQAVDRSNPVDLETSINPASGVSKKSGASEKGGIDLRALPIVTQPMNPMMLKGISPQGIAPSLVGIPDKEWQEIERMVNAGIRPSLERIREYLVLSCKGADCQVKIDQALSGIVDILRLEEEYSSLTAAGLKEILVLLESNKPAGQLSAALAKIVIAPQEPIRI